jgi:xylulose-5-phosphate/fructose-6-phosphate phosphoketolase
VIDRVPGLSVRAAHVNQWVRDELTEHRLSITEHGEDLPEIRNWRWQARTGGR